MGKYEKISVLYDKVLALRKKEGDNSVQENKVIDALCKYLTHNGGTNSHMIREKSACVLGALGNDRAAEPLIDAMDDGHGGVRRCAYEALQELDKQIVTELLIKALSDKGLYAKVYATIMLGEMDDVRMQAPLIRALGDECDDVRKAAAKALRHFADKGIIDGAQAAEPLIKALNDANNSVRYHAAEALGMIGDARAAEPLVHAMSDTDDFVRKEAAAALVKIDEKRAVQPLTVALADTYFRLREYASKELYRLGKRELAHLANGSRQDFIRVAQTKDPIFYEQLTKTLRCYDDKTRRSAAEALAIMGDARAVAPLIAALDDECDEVRASAVKALGAFDDTCAVLPLIKKLADNNRDVRINAANVLGEMGDTRAVEPMIRMLEDKDVFSLRHVVKVLGQLKDRRAAEPIIEVFNETSSRVARAKANYNSRTGYSVSGREKLYVERDETRLVCIEALGEIGGENAVRQLVEALGCSDNAFVSAALRKVISEMKTEPDMKDVCNWAEERIDYYNSKSS